MPEIIHDVPGEPLALFFDARRLVPAIGWVRPARLMGPVHPDWALFLCVRDQPSAILLTSCYPGSLTRIRRNAESLNRVLHRECLRGGPERLPTELKIDSQSIVIVVNIKLPTVQNPLLSVYRLIIAVKSALNFGCRSSHLLVSVRSSPAATPPLSEHVSSVLA